MVLETCHITFDNGVNSTLYGGDKVSGVVCFSLEHQKILKDLVFKVEGITTCRWTHSTKAGSTTRTTSYTSHEDHFKSVSSLVGRYQKNEDGEVVLEPGDHKFAFSFTLPIDIPSSFEAEFGRTRYTIKVTAERRQKLDDDWKLPLSVVYKYDLNKNPACIIPAKGRIVKNFSCFCLSQGTLHIVVSLPITGFVSGQTIQMNCDVKNHSEVDITQILFKLVQETTFISTLPRKFTKQTRSNITQFVGRGVSEGEETSYPITLSVPALPPTNTTGFIQTTYFLKVKATSADIHGDPSCRIPITIGTIPLLNTQFVNYGRIPMVDNTRPSPTAPPFIPPTPTLPIDDSSKSDDPPSYHLLAPPTYEEAQTSLKMLDPHPEDKDGKTHFNPRYPVYKFPLMDS